jgi:hypothetical protein
VATIEVGGRHGSTSRFDRALAGKSDLFDERTVLEVAMEASLSLCGTRATIERLEHILKTGEPLLNKRSIASPSEWLPEELRARLPAL